MTHTLRSLVVRGSRRQWRGLLVLTLIMLGEVVLSVAAPWPMKWLIDHVLRGDPAPGWLARFDRDRLLLFAAGATFAIFLAGAVLNLVQSWVSIGFGQRLMYDLSADLFAHVQRLSLKFHARSSVGDLLRRVTGDTGCVTTIVRDCALPIAASALTLVAMFAVLVTVDGQLALVSLATVPPLFWLARRFGGQIAERSYAYAEAEARAYEQIERALSAVPVIQAFAREAMNDAALQRTYARALGAALCENAAQLRLKISAGAVTALATAVLVWLGAYKVVHGQLTTGELWMFLAYLASVYWPLESLIDSTVHIRDAAGSARRVLEVLNRDQDVVERASARPLVVRGASGATVEFDRVSFGYEPGRAVLHDISLAISPGEVVGLVGESGAGKTTLMSLVPRLFDPQTGAVRINGTDLRDLTLASLRRHVGFVLQRPILFPMSITDNIAYARPDATRQEVEAAARAAQAHDFITELPQGYDTVVGERGSTLSGGQRQRVTIARALLHDSPVLLLDEPTSALDGETENELVAALRNLVRGRTTFVIAHRFSTLRLATRIIVLHAGRVIEHGTHEQLMNLNGKYASLYRLQFAGTAEVSA